MARNAPLLRGLLVVVLAALGGLAHAEQPKARPVRHLPRVEQLGLTIARENPTYNQLVRIAKPRGKVTQYGTLAFSSSPLQRSPSRAVQDGQVTAADRKALTRAVASLQGQKLIETWGKLGTGRDARVVRLVVPEKYAQDAALSDILFPRITARERGQLGWAQQEGFTTVMIPDYGRKPRILVDTDRRVTYVLGSSYFGERKKSALRMWWRELKETRGAIPLHASAMTVILRGEGGELARHSTIVLGHSGTGKSTLSTGDEGLSAAAGERIIAHQDDAGALVRTGKGPRSWRFVGTEHGMYLKTEGVSPTSDPGAYEGIAATGRRARVGFDNVAVGAAGKVDFLDTSANKNGRAAVDRKLISMSRGQPINMGRPQSIVMISRHELLPAIARVPAGQPEKGAFAYALGESVKTSAAGGSGETIRETGFSSFIVGPPAKEANRMLDFLREQSRTSSGTRAYIMNTGSVRTAEGLVKVQKSDTMRLLRAMQRGAITWQLDPRLGLEVPVAVKGMTDAELQRLGVGRGMSPAELGQLTDRVRADRVEFLKKNLPDLDAAIIARGAY